MKRRLRFVLITMATVLSVGITASLGQWQLTRAADKVALQASIDAQFEAAPIDTHALTTHPDARLLLHRRVSLRGEWLPEHTVYLDNRQMQGRVGLYVVTPFRLDASAVVIAVQRGWVVRNFMDRTVLASVQTPSGIVQIQGRIVPPPSRLYELGDAQSGLIRQNLDLQAFGQELGMPLMAMSVQQIGASSEGLLRDWPIPATGVDKHYGYAFQWFGLCALFLLLYVWFQIVRQVRSAPR